MLFSPVIGPLLGERTVWKWLEEHRRKGYFPGIARLTSTHPPRLPSPHTHSIPLWPDEWHLSQRVCPGTGFMFLRSQGLPSDQVSWWPTTSGKPDLGRCCPQQSHCLRQKMTGQTRWTKLSNPQGIIPNCYPARLVCVLEMPISFLERKRDMNLPKNVHMSVCMHECVCVCPGPACGHCRQRCSWTHGLWTQGLCPCLVLFDELGSPNIDQLGQVPQPAMQIR